MVNYNLNWIKRGNGLSELDDWKPQVQRSVVGLGVGPGNTWLISEVRGITSHHVAD